MKATDMQEQLSTADAGWLAVILYKLLPAAAGAAIMVAVQLPSTRREWFNRIFVALACSLIFADFTFDLLHSFSLFAFLDPHKKSHVAAVAGLIGSSAWFVMGGAGMWLAKFRSDPGAALDDAKRAQ